jgi:hypothetical protein
MTDTLMFVDVTEALIAVAIVATRLVDSDSWVGSLTTTQHTHPQIAQRTLQQGQMDHPIPNRSSQSSTRNSRDLRSMVRVVRCMARHLAPRRVQPSAYRRKGGQLASWTAPVEISQQRPKGSRACGLLTKLERLMNSLAPIHELM